MRKGIATVSLSGVLEDKLAAAAGVGFDAVELFDQDLIGSPLAPREVAARCADLGLEIALFQPVRDVEGVAPEAFGAVLHRLRTKLGVMAELGTTTLLACSNASSDAIDDLDLTAEQLHRVGELAAEAGVTVAFEALAWGRHVNRVGGAWEAVVRADHPAVTVAVDTFHLLARGDDGTALEGIPGDRIGFLQVADAPWLDMNLLEWSRHHRCFPGQGALDVTGVVTATLSAGYRGPLSLEVFSDVVRENDPEVTARDAMRSLVFLEDEVSLRAPELDGVLVSAAPPVPTRTHAAFLELACVPGDDRVDKLLDGLGFTPAGHHRSKPARWWRNGEAHVVVNEGKAERASWSASALGVSAHPVEAVAARARALLWPEVGTSRGPGEAILPGIASPSGLQVFISDTPGRHDHWQGDFVASGIAAAGTTASTTTGTATGLDHVVIAVSPLQLNEEVAFFRTVFGLVPRSAEEFMEPHGRLRSIALRPAEGDVRIVLNVIEAPPDTQPPHGVTQVALRCHDVAEAVAGLASREVPLLRIPDNYYVDLGARFDLAPQVLDHLREHQLLYDRVGDGELLHAFTEDLGAGFHVELLERRGGYDGYGSPNTFVRLAAAAR